MNNRSTLFFTLTVSLFASALCVRAQTSTPSNVYTRPRTVGVAQQAQTPGAQAPAPRPAATQTPSNTDPATQRPAQTQTPAPTATRSAAPSATPYAAPVPNP
ncbi:MAG: hypothetical protein M3379_14250, partial [Acidobacteriota bacterium]|nr:hypothetical protein [Acidobacteriota bacterium]